MKHDVIVIGAGLSGLMAAKTAADCGLRTLILAKGMGMIHVSPGGIDLLGYYPEESMEIEEDPFSALGRLIEERPDHPYSKVGLEDLEHALASLSALFSSGGYRYTGEGRKNTVLPTGIGSARPSYLVPSTMVGGKGVFSEPTLLVGFHEFAGFYPAYAARNLRNSGGEGGGGPEVRSGYVEVADIGGRNSFKGSSLALQFDVGAFREAVAERVRGIMEGERLVGFPAVLGLRDPQGVKLDLEARIGSEVFELSVLPPSIPGMRLFDAFQRALRAKGVKMIQGVEVVSAVRKGRHCRGVVVKTPSGQQRVHEADSFVLATGRFFGGGLRAEHDRIVEPIFDLPVVQPEGRAEWFSDDFFAKEGHPINRAGIKTNDRLNPVDGKGGPVLENLFLAGSILGHHDPAREKSGSGVAVGTGYKAVQNLVEK
ncbi:MAG: glycerol-3-phosphate dehydrogenase subunit GlpB [Deltaproteobacteria bacterium]|nr:glycerol-3-phosphate dehydrogenase subunit GlpB [Deltaproteobacteria bacterium]MBW2122834.1 glycerol-3-phosphate dehydrogenase subunit GlpB [Deltaproteobacteria bacterium]